MPPSTEIQSSFLESGAPVVSAPAAPGGEAITLPQPTDFKMSSAIPRLIAEDAMNLEPGPGPMSLAPTSTTSTVGLQLAPNSSSLPWIEQLPALPRVDDPNLAYVLAALKQTYGPNLSLQNAPHSSLDSHFATLQIQLNELYHYVSLLENSRARADQEIIALKEDLKLARDLQTFH